MHVATAIVHFDSTTRTIIDGRTAGFCKLIVDRVTHEIRGCHIVGEQAVEITQIAAIAIAAGMRVDDLARVSTFIPHLRGDSRSSRRNCNPPLDLKASPQPRQAESVESSRRLMKLLQKALPVTMLARVNLP